MAQYSEMFAARFLYASCWQRLGHDDDCMWNFNTMCDVVSTGCSADNLDGWCDESRIATSTHDFPGSKSCTMHKRGEETITVVNLYDGGFMEHGQKDMTHKDATVSLIQTHTPDDDKFPPPSHEELSKAQTRKSALKSNNTGAIAGPSISPDGNSSMLQDAHSHKRNTLRAKVHFDSHVEEVQVFVLESEGMMPLQLLNSGRLRPKDIGRLNAARLSQNNVSISKNFNECFQFAKRFIHFHADN